MSMMISSIWFILIYFWCIFEQTKATLVTLQDGSPIVGEVAQSAHGKTVSQGIPFAEPPVGNLRFRKPIPKAPWRTIYNATKYSNACIQSMDTYFGDFFGATMWNSNVPMSEDCLYLNVFVPGRIDPNKKLSVIIWIYGGGFWSGCASLDAYDGKILASEEDIIVVSMNYRVSLFGFLYLGKEEAPGNMGLFDQLLAIKWVHKNIAEFGGDPEQITLMGESAGSASVNLHAISEKSTPYFQRAILQSGSATAPWAIENRQIALHRAVILYEYLKCGNMSHSPEFWDMNKVYRCLMEATPEKLRDSEWAPVMEFADFPWVPVIDGDFLIENAHTSLKQGHFVRLSAIRTQYKALFRKKHSYLPAQIWVFKFSKFNLLSIEKTLAKTGNGNLTLKAGLRKIVYQLADVFPPSDFFTKKDFVKGRDAWLRSISNLLPRQMLKSSLALQSIIHEYEPDITAEPQHWVDSLDKMLGDLQFTCSVNEMALAHSLHGGDTYYYYFTHRATQQTWPSWMGVLHGYEIMFIFGEPYNTERFNYTKEEQELSFRFMRYWGNFARTGDPNKNKDGTYMADNWPKYNSQTMEYMNLTVESDYQKGANPDVGESFIRWKQQMDRWENDYMTDWQFHFEQYKKHQTYRRMDDDKLEQCIN
ncbi:Carboxylic ester hydrolase [Aphelenchoides bicaudatus]|nr:Carboxylic ester hydrolase [Aphelenchoides bicaudatus]